MCVCVCVFECVCVCVCVCMSVYVCVCMCVGGAGGPEGGGGPVRYNCVSWRLGQTDTETTAREMDIREREGLKINSL